MRCSLIIPQCWTLLLVFSGIIILTLGQRYDIIFDANQAVGNYWIHALPATFCSANDNENNILAIVRYDGSDTSADPTSIPYVPSNNLCQDEQNLVPVLPINVGTFGDDDTFDISLIPQNGFVKWTINASSFVANYSDPTLLMVDNHNPAYPRDFNVVTLNGTSDTVHS